ncbi:response regulator [Variovorax sp. J22P168]|uniref:response regulator n=1 Tax=Variovorax jilinensis TaxID=3053513 RepID=UPI0025750500|nr:response regulator [Variovorax sp. J22P168]MDM0015235.1 response regulator [Variovorax sp. J22P168]
MNSRLPHILVANEDPAVQGLLTEYLSDNELRVSTATTVEQMFMVLKEAAVDLVMLDLRIDGHDGLQLASELRSSSDIPVIFLTGKCDEADRVMGLEIAADDYITEPFSRRELLARIRSVLRRYRLSGNCAHLKESTRRAYRFAGWELNLMTRRLRAPEGQRVALSNGEFNLLLAMCEAPERVLTRDQLLDLSRLHGAEVYVRSVDVQVMRLRRKIEADPSEPRFILTERGAGYLFNAKVSALS